MNAAAAPALSVDAFEAGNIDVAAFDHEAHIYIAWLYLEKSPLLDAIGGFASALRRLTAQLGIPGKYHETITWFFMVLIQQRRSDSGATDWSSFQRKNADLFVGGEANILHRYYSSDVLASDRARQSFILPDRLRD